MCPGAKLVAVSEYSAIHLVEIFNLRFDAVIQNPVKKAFLSEPEESKTRRDLITYVGRLDPAKNIHRLLPAICGILKEHPGLQACIVGDGAQSAALKKMVSGEPRVHFTGPMDSQSVRDVLRRTKVFISGNQTEPFGITYVEALSQGCAVAMPASGGGIEIAPQLIGRQIFLLPISLERSAVQSTIERALTCDSAATDVSMYSAANVASAYLSADTQPGLPCSQWSSRNAGFAKR
jgi:glycosyltransferase involved in cell wall biosynthesis